MYKLYMLVRMELIGPWYDVACTSLYIATEYILACTNNRSMEFGNYRHLAANNLELNTRAKSSI